MASFEEGLKSFLRKYYLYVPLVLVLMAIIIGLGQVTEFGIFNPWWIFLDVIMFLVLLGIVAVAVIIHERITGPGRM